jgi:hypothetical protein
VSMSTITSPSIELHWQASMTVRGRSFWYASIGLTNAQAHML